MEDFEFRIEPDPHRLHCVIKRRVFTIDITGVALGYEDGNAKTTQYLAFPTFATARIF